jgi:hypothetical protein
MIVVPTRPGIRLGLCAVFALAAAMPSRAQPTPPVSDAAQELVGAWEISNADRDKRCAVTFSVDPAPGGLKLELDPACGTTFPPLKDVVVWKLGPGDAVWLVDAKGAAVLEFNEVESGMYEGERKGEGLYFMQTQTALKAETPTADQLFGDWRVLRELEKPLCTLTLSNAPDGNDKYKVVVKRGCDASIADFGLTTWQLDRDQLLLAGRGGTWRFSESDPTTWERMPLSTDPLLLMRP